MPTEFNYGYDSNWTAERRRREKAWSAHYQAKGCNSTKAEWLAREKVNRKSTWPPK